MANINSKNDRSPTGWPPRSDAIRNALLAAFDSGDWGRYEGPNLEQLSQACAERFQMEHALPCASGTVAVQLALRGLGVSAGDEVVLAGYDFSGNFQSIHSVGARPVLVDVTPQRWTVDLNQLESALSSATKVIIASHLHGDLAPMKTLRSLAEAKGVLLLEDACQSPGAVVDGRPVGSWGHAATLSFGGSKLLTAGRGGMVLTNDPQVKQRIIIASEQGNHAYPLSELQASVLRPQLDTLDEWNETRLREARYAAECLGDVGLRWLSFADKADQRAATFRWGCWVDEEAARERGRIEALASAEGVSLNAGFRGFARRSRTRCEIRGTLTQSQLAADRTLLLHHGQLLLGRQKVQAMVQTIAGVMRQVLASEA